MILRIVRMEFLPDQVDTFLSLFEARKAQIRHFEGCRHLELWRDSKDPAVFSTYSHWDSEEALNHYRYSELFKETWGRTKQLFAAPPSAFSMVLHTEVK